MTQPPKHPMIEEPRPPPREVQDTFPELGGGTLDSLFEEIAAHTLDETPTVRTRLRDLPTPRRRGLAVAGMTIVGLVAILLHGVRADLSGPELLRFALSTGVLLAVSLGAASLTLRAAHERPLGVWTWRVAVGALVLPLLASLVPGWWPGVQTTTGAPMVVHLGCGAAGFAAALASAATILLFDREDWSTRWRILSAAAAGGLVGYVTQGVSCPLVDLDHLVFAHAAQGLVVWGVLWVWSGVERR